MPGDVPDGWGREPLGNLGQFLKCRGGSKKDEVPTGVPVVRYGQLYTQYETVIREFFSFVSPDRAGDYTPLKYGDVLFAGSGETLEEIGKAAVFLGDGAAAHGSGDLILLRPSAAVDPLFLGYCANGGEANAQKLRLGQGSSVFHISADRLAGLQVATPPLPEQKKIAAILSSVDEAIQATQLVIDQTRRVKEGLLQDLLTRGTRGETLRVGHHGARPASWSEPQAADVCGLITKGTTPPQAAMQRSGEVPFLRVGNLTFDGSLDLSDLLFVDRSTHENVLRRSMIYQGDVLTNIVGPPLGQVALVDERHAQWNINQAIAVFRVDARRVLPPFLAMVLQWREAQTWLSSRAKKTSGQLNLTLELCRTLPIPLPDIVEQAEIVERFASVDASLQALVRMQVGHRALKAGLLQDLLTGKVRVSP